MRDKHSTGRGRAFVWARGDSLRSVQGALLFVAAVAVLLIPVPATADAPVYGARITCTPKSTQPARVCSLAASPRAIFRAFADSDVRYLVCVDKPRAKSRC